jgi:hypothetical protein
MLNFYVNQFSAMSNALAQFFILAILLTYRRWYLGSSSLPAVQVDDRLLGREIP